MFYGPHARVAALLGPSKLARMPLKWGVEANINPFLRWRFGLCWASGAIYEGFSGARIRRCSFRGSVMRSLQIEALFGGVLALVVLGIAIYAVANTTFGGPNGSATVTPDPTGTMPVIQSSTPVSLAASSGQDLICECYDRAFDLAGKVKVLSPEYRTGFEQCRARGGVDGGDAWTAGWNARLSSKPYEASCRSYKRRL